MGSARRADNGRSPLTVAAAQPAVVADDVAAAAAVHAAVVRSAGARVVVFPELSLTGYELGADAIDPADPRLSTIIEACADAGAAALVGAPVVDDGRRYIAVLHIDRRGVSVAYRKMSLGIEEQQHFAVGMQPGMVEIDGWRIGLGICRDINSEWQVGRTVAQGIDAYLAGVVHHADERAAQDARGLAIAREGNVFVAFASCADTTGGGFHDTAGQSTIWSPTGAVLARAGTEPGDIAIAELTPAT